MDIFDMIDAIDDVVIADTETEIEIPKVIEELRENPPFILNTLNTIDKVDEYGMNRGTMGLDFGYNNLNKAFNGLNPGLTLIAGGANTGKSALLLALMTRIVEKNQYQDENHPKKAYCLYFSLDDSNNELMPRMIASSEGMQINQVLFPKTLVDKPELLKKRENGFKNLKRNAPFFSMFDADNGQSIQKIEEIIEMIHQQLEMVYPNEFQMVIFIDNFHDIDYETESGFMEDNAKYDYISNRLNELAIKYDAPVLCSAEFRKINSQKRPQPDDIKSTGKITYEAKGIILVHNEVGLLGDDAELFWEIAVGDNSLPNRKMPILEMHVAKNKFGPFKGREFLRFLPEQARFFEPTEEENKTYRALLKS